MMIDTDQDSEKRVCVGVVVGAHGLRGLVRIRPFTDVPEDVGVYGPVETEDGSRSFVLDVRNRAGKGQILVQVEGIDDRTKAEGLKGLKFFVPRDRLPEAEDDEFYNADLLGLAIVGQDGEIVGTVRAVQNFGAGDILEIDEVGGGVSTIPFTLSAVPEVHIAEGRTVVDAAQILRSGGSSRKEDN
jgi:16S rRNA processing protein RimM